MFDEDYEEDTTFNVELADKIDDLFQKIDKTDKRKKLEINVLKNKLNDYITIFNRQAGSKIYNKVKL